MTSSRCGCCPGRGGWSSTPGLTRWGARGATRRREKNPTKPTKPTAPPPSPPRKTPTAAFLGPPGNRTRNLEFLGFDVGSRPPRRSSASYAAAASTSSPRSPTTTTPTKLPPEALPGRQGAKTTRRRTRTAPWRYPWTDGSRGCDSSRGAPESCAVRGSWCASRGGARTAGTRRPGWSSRSVPPATCERRRRRFWPSATSPFQTSFRPAR